MKQTGMLVVSLRGLNFGFGVFRAKCQYFKPPRSRLGFREETQNYAKRNRSQIFFLTCFVYRIRGQNLLKVGVHLKAIFTPLKIGQMEISCLHFKQRENPPFITQINDLGRFMNFWVIFRYIWKEIIFHEGLVKLKEIRNVEDLVKF